MKQNGGVCIMRRRNTTNEFLKECIADALLRLLKEKPMEAITIQEITDLADVGRVTYYRNFSSKEDVILFKLSLLCETWIETIIPEDLQNEKKMAMQFFIFIRSMEDVVIVLYRANLWFVFLNFLYQYLGPQEGFEKEEIYKSSFLAYGLFGITSEWIKGGMVETEEQLGEMLMKVLLIKK